MATGSETKNGGTKIKGETTASKRQASIADKKAIASIVAPEIHKSVEIKLSNVTLNFKSERKNHIIHEHSELWKAFVLRDAEKEVFRRNYGSKLYGWPTKAQALKELKEFIKENYIK